MLIRHASPNDYAPVIAVLDEWWGGRAMTDMVPRLFFTKFRPTSFVIERPGDDAAPGIRAFLCGFVSETDPADAYIHFVGVHPDERGTGVGRRLYERFFAEVTALGCARVNCVTGPVNTGSVAFHTAMGFSSKVVADYDGRGNDRVVFERRLDDPSAPSTERPPAWIRPTTLLAGIAAAHRRLLATLELEPWDPTAPSRLPGWTIGHTVTHLARNADAIAGLCESAARGEAGHQYAGGAEQRNADIEAGAARDADALLGDLRRANASFEHAAALVPDDAWATGVGHSMFGPVPLIEWPFRRWREVEIHHADLGLGFGFDDWSQGFVEREWSGALDELGDRLAAGTTVRLVATDEPDGEWVVGADGPSASTLGAPRRDLLAWMLGRHTIAGAPAIGSAA